VTVASNAVRPFTIDVPAARVQRILAQLADKRWPEPPADTSSAQPDWRYGTDVRWLRRLVDHWTGAYDWPAAQQQLNRWPQFIARIDDLDIHFIHVRGSGTGRVPLLLLHGWPGSFFEFHKLVERLCWPQRHGGDAADGCDLVIPSLPGFGFSAAPPSPIGLHRVAGLMHRLMTDVLGYPRYGVQGGDMGSAIATWLALDHPAQVAGIHLNLCLMAAADTQAPIGDEELAWARAMQATQAREMAYWAVHHTRPQTIALALADNPAGVAAWIVEKLQRWSDTGNDPLQRYTQDELITLLMVYLVTDSIGPSIWMYRGTVDQDSAGIPAGARIAVPTACALFPKEFLPWPPRSRIERTFNVRRWSVMERGGHFPALEEPQALADDVMAFFRELRG
jgi:pimeloyl-ACP methyl ester carboxylesterase